MATVRAFVSSARLTSFPLATFDDRGLLSLVQGSIKTSELVALRKFKGELEGDASAIVKQRRLLRKIEGMAGRTLNHAGRSYKLVADADLAKLPARNSYEVVGHTEAATVLDALAQQSGTAADLVASFALARSGLAADWRPPHLPEGLILLRKIIALQSFIATTEPVYSPSQLQRLFQPSGVIDIELVDMDGVPAAGESWELVLPDGSKRSGQLDQVGQATITAVPNAGCQVTFPQLDAGAWSPCA